MLRYTKIHGMSHVDVPGPGGGPGPRLWAQFILIDEPKSKEDRRERAFGDVRQIRGCTNGGLPVFTFWIHPDAEVSIEQSSGGRSVLMSHDGNAYALDGGVVIRAKWPDGELVLTATAANYREPKITVEKIEVECCPHGSQVDEDILKSYQAPAYCVTAYVPKEQALELSRKLENGMIFPRR